MFLVYPQLPRTGLGNMLLVWARAVLFAELNSFPVVTPNWGQIRVGPYLRGERDKRYYGNLFSNKNYISQLQLFLRNLQKHQVYYNLSIAQIDLSQLKSEGKAEYLFIFNKLPHWSEHFVDLKEYQPIIKQKLLEIIRPSVFKNICNYPAPEIGVHIRMGDFRVLKAGDDFTKLGGVRTPISWYARVISEVRKITNYDVPVTVFSDGHNYELSEILKLPKVSRSPSSSALYDMFTLSKSKLLITSSGSTFSSWASYLGQCPTIWHPAHFHSGLLTSQSSKTVFEGGFDPETMAMPNLLIQNINSAF